MIVELNKKEINEEKIGNKGKFLLQMKKNGFNVPSGIILDSDAYDFVIKDNKLEKLLNQINKDNINDISKKIISEFNNVKINKDLLDEIKSKLKKNKKYAVRSSGTKEDLENYSFAGQYETFLNTPIDEIENRIIDCYKSMYSEVILSYLLNNNVSFDNLKMSVVIQEMVNSDYSGICFTIDPTTGNDKKMIIEISKGLGENIVSGKTAPEQYFYNWYDKSVEYDKSNKFLKKKQVEEFGEEFLKIQLFFGYPCDIEFAVEDDKLYILQARKITKVKYSGIKDIWTTADFKDGGVSATICTPYMWSLYEYIWEYALRKFIMDSKILKDEEMPKKLGEMFYARCYWNLSVVKKAMSQVIGYKEREFDSEYGVKITYEGDGDTTSITPKSIFKILSIAIAQSGILKERREKNNYLKEDLLSKYTKYKEDYDNNNIKDIESTWYKLTKEDYLYSESTYFWQIFINTIHQSLYKDSLLKYVSESDYLSLLGSIDNISHLLPFYDMWDISRNIRNDKEALKFWNSNDSITIEKQLNKDNYYLKDTKKLIETYGYHSDKELDITYPCYYEEENVLIQMIKEMVNLEDKFSPIEDKNKGTEKYKLILKDIESKVSKNKYKKIDKKVKTMRKMLWWREEFRDISTRFYYLLRVYALEYAKYLKAKNVLTDVEDIWFLKIGDLWDYVENKKDKKDLQNIINKNKIYYNSYRNFMSENEIGSIFGNASENINKDNSNVIKGLGANNGTITGTARVIKDFSEIDRLQKDDILITKFTDTGWTSKFAILSGIVTEYGGILCHAAIVSREYGIPAIVCCHDVMSKVKDGQKITINGTTGEVIIEE